MTGNDYVCRVCGKNFINARNRDLHEKNCGVKSLKEYSEVEQSDGSQ